MQFQILLRSRLLPLLACLLWLGFAPLCRGAGETCEICKEVSNRKLYLLTDPVRSRQLIVCDRCARLSTVCTTCRLPVFEDYTTLEDGRLLCAADARDAVLDDTQAQSIFSDVKRDLFAIFSGLGVLPDRNIHASLTNQKELMRIFAATPGAHPDGSLQGVTRSRRYGKDSFEHQVFLCLGLSRARTAAVAAHEYAHAWIHENRAADRILDRDTEEAFCELTAYQLMQQRGSNLEIKAILQNTYTRGKIDVLVKVSESYQFYRVAEWVKSGKDETLEHQRPDRVITLRDSPQPLFGYLPEVHARAPEVLRLKGLSGRPPRRFALINDATLQEGESGKVGVGDRQVVVRCEHIGDAVVRVRIQGQTNSLELILGAEAGLDGRTSR